MGRARPRRGHESSAWQAESPQVSRNALKSRDYENYEFSFFERAGRGVAAHADFSFLDLAAAIPFW
jgi:hypothetical protein